MIQHANFPIIKKKHVLSLPQKRVLKILYDSHGPITRARVAVRLGTGNQVYVGKAVGFSDPQRRYEFERSKEGGGRPEFPNLSLLSLGYIVEVDVNVDGISETGLLITDEGKAAFESLPPDAIPPMRN